MLTCVNEIIRGWPLLRRMMLITFGEANARLYDRSLGAGNWYAMEDPRLLWLQVRGPGNIPRDFSKDDAAALEAAKKEEAPNGV
jgi:hypothetical protein